MIRQAYTYLVGALSAVVVIGVAIGVFVVLVCAQVFHELPIPVLSGHDQKTAVAPAKMLTPADRQAVAAVPPSGTQQGGGGAEGAGQATAPPPGGDHQGAAGPTSDGTATSTAPHRVGPGTVDGEAAGGQGGTGDSQPSTPANPPASTPPSSPAGNPGQAGPGKVVTGTSGSGSSGSGTGGGNGSGSSRPSAPVGGSTGSSGATAPSAPVTTAKPSEVITETVNETVGSVDETVGGTLSEVGVTHVTEEVVNGVAGPESVVGKTVDGVGEVLGGLTGGHGH